MINPNVVSSIQFLTDMIKQVFSIMLPIGITFGELVIGILFMPVLFKALKVVFGEYVVSDSKDTSGGKRSGKGS